jgi:outer membrane protein TolC
MRQPFGRSLPPIAGAVTVVVAAVAAAIFMGPVAAAGQEPLPSGAAQVRARAAAAPVSSQPAASQDPERMDSSRLSRGAPAFPRIWAPYRPLVLPPVDLHNPPILEQLIAGGTLRLSIHDFLRLVLSSNLDLYAAQYDAAIAEVDLLRAVSGQAARGTSSAPLPGALFAGAIGAGVSSTAALSPGGTGGAAISTQGRLVTFGPRGNFDPTVSLNLSYDHLVNPLNTRRVAGVAAVTVPSTVLQTRFQQELPYGTSYSVSFNLQRQSSTQVGLLFDPAVTSFFALQVYQPLLNGFGLALTKRFVTLADNNRKIVREALQTKRNDTLAAAANAYWDLIAARERVRVAEQARAAAQQQYDEGRQRVDLGAMTPLEVLTAESELASTRVQVVIAQTTLEQQQLSAKTLISRVTEPALDATRIEPTEPLPGPDDLEVPPLGSSITAALANRSAIRLAQLGIRNQHIAEQFTHKNLLPTFSVYAAVDQAGLAPGASSAVRQLLKASYPEYSVGFTWSLPLFNRSAQADDVRARLETQEAEADLRRTTTRITQQVQTATLSLAQGRAEVQAAQRAVVASRRAYEGEQDRLRAGISTPYRVMLAQRDLTSSQFAEIQARVAYAKAFVAYRLAVGGLNP